MPNKRRWPPVLSKRDRERREKYREKLASNLENTFLRVLKERASRKDSSKVFSKPHWPPVISEEEKERRRKFRKSLERGSAEAAPSTSQQWPPKLEEKERRRKFRKSLERGSAEAAPSTSQQWPPKLEEKERSLERGSAEAAPSTSQQWPPKLKTVKVSVPPCASLSLLPPPPAVADAALKRVPRATAWRRKKRAEEDRKVLKLGRATARRRDPKGYPCQRCGQRKRLEFGHSFFRGKHFCATAEGRTVSEWLSEQKRLAAADNVQDVPRTTAWRRRKAEEALAKGLYYKEPKPRKALTCSLCKQPKMKEYGHSRYGGKAFCSTHEGKTVELWLAEQRALGPLK